MNVGDLKDALDRLDPDLDVVAGLYVPGAKIDFRVKNVVGISLSWDNDTDEISVVLVTEMHVTRKAEP